MFLGLVVWFVIQVAISLCWSGWSFLYFCMVLSGFCIVFSKYMYFWLGIVHVLHFLMISLCCWVTFFLLYLATFLHVGFQCKANLIYVKRRSFMNTNVIALNLYVIKKVSPLSFLRFCISYKRNLLLIRFWNKINMTSDDSQVTFIYKAL